jgi:hypothetical protein
MKTPNFLAAAFALAAALVPITAISQLGPGIVTDTQAAKFLESLQEAVTANDAKGVARLMAFPLAVTTPAASAKIADGNSFLQSYKLIFTDSVRAAVLAQKPEILVPTAKGVMIGNGEVWFGAVCVDTKCSSTRVGVTAVNVLPAKKK